MLLDALLACVLAFDCAAAAWPQETATTPASGKAVSAKGEDSGVASMGARSKMHGVIISTHGNGQDWGSDAIVPTMRDIQELGGNWVAIHPYAGIRADGTVTWRAIDAEHPPRWLERPIAQAHALGLKILIMPHLAYWRSPFTWKGDIGFTEGAAWERFFATYADWITQLAAACKDADAMVVGTELDKTIAHNQEWRGIIARVRTATKAKLSYAANWTDYEEVGFWDALDVIGIQAYFPLCEQDDPQEKDLAAAWSARMRALAVFAAKAGRRIVFTELGYNRSRDAAKRPWDSRVDGPEAESLQQCCMRVALRAIEQEPSVVGAFLWKWFPGPRAAGRDFQLATPPMKSVIAGVWLAH